jgi:hypothetical protein
MYADTMVYQVTWQPRNPNERALVLAITSKQSAQRLVAALAEQEGRLDGCEVIAFKHPTLPGMEVER